MSELIILNWIGVGGRGLGNERQRIAGSGDGVLARLCCRVVTEMVRLHPGWLVPQRGVVATQSANVGSRILEMCDFSQCVTHWRGSIQLDCDGHTSRYDHWDSREALRDAQNEL